MDHLIYKFDTTVIWVKIAYLNYDCVMRRRLAASFFGSKRVWWSIDMIIRSKSSFNLLILVPWRLITSHGSSNHFWFFDDEFLYWSASFRNLIFQIDNPSWFFRSISWLSMSTMNVNLTQFLIFHVKMMEFTAWMVINCHLLIRVLFILKITLSFHRLKTRSHK